MTLFCNKLENNSSILTFTTCDKSMTTNTRHDKQITRILIFIKDNLLILLDWYCSFQISFPETQKTYHSIYSNVQKICV